MRFQRIKGGKGLIFAGQQVKFLVGNVFLVPLQAFMERVNDGRSGEQSAEQSGSSAGADG